jgi:hypothetical protein
LNGFTLIDSFLPEEEVNEKYRKNQTIINNHCAIYFLWFKKDGERFADVYASNECYTEKHHQKILKTAKISYVNQE